MAAAIAASLSASMAVGEPSPAPLAGADGVGLGASLGGFGGFGGFGGLGGDNAVVPYAVTSVVPSARRLGADGSDRSWDALSEFILV